MRTINFHVGGTPNTSAFRIRYVVLYGPRNTRKREEFYETWAQVAAVEKRLQASPKDVKPGSIVIDAITIWHPLEDESTR